MEWGKWKGDIGSVKTTAGKRLVGNERPELYQCIYIFKFELASL